MKIRRLVVDKGELAAEKGSDGAWVFDTADLDTLREHLANEGGATVPSSQEPVAAGIDSELGTEPEPAEPELPPNYAPTRHQTQEIASWLLAACEPEVEAELALAAQPFVGSPLGATSMPTWLATYPASRAPAQIAEIEAARREADAARAQADATAHECQRWAAAWRRERVAAVAGAIAVEVVTTGQHASPLVLAVRDRVAHALNALPDAHLKDEAYVYAVARSVASPTIAWHAHAAQESARYREPVDDLARARWRGRRRF